MKLEAAIEQCPPLVELTIQSSATLQKGSKILIDVLGLASHPSKRTGFDPTSGLAGV